MKKLLFVTLALCMAQLLAVAGTEKDCTIKVDGKSRQYKLYVPTNVKDNCPFVLSMHGSGGSMNDKSPFGEDVADWAGCIVAYPSGLSTYFPIGFGGYAPGWTASGENNDDVKFLLALIDDVASKYKIDRKRLYCCGFSNGGMMTYAMSNACSDVFAAFASISGFPLNEFHLRLTGKRPVPFLHIHGKSDDFVKYSLMPKIVSQMVMRNGANPVPVKTVKSGKYTKSVYEATEGGFPYVYYEMNGMGHSPFTNNTEDGNSSKTMWNFFKQYTLDAPCDTTLKWRPAVETEGFVPKEFGIFTTDAYVFYYGDTPQASGKNDKNNVYRTLQFVDGKYKLSFKTQGEAGKTTTVKLQKLTGTKNLLIDTTVNVGEEVTLPFEVSDGWGEYRLTLSHAKNDDFTVSNLSIHSLTADEVNSVGATLNDKGQMIDDNFVYDLSGRRLAAAPLHPGLYIMNHKKVLVR